VTYPERTEKREGKTTISLPTNDDGNDDRLQRRWQQWNHSCLAYGSISLDLSALADGEVSLTTG